MTTDIGDEDKLRELTKIIEDLFRGFSVSNYRSSMGSGSPEEMSWRAAVEAWFFQEIMVFRKDLEHLLATLPDIIGNDPSEVLDLSGCAEIEANLDGRKYVITIMPHAVLMSTGISRKPRVKIEIISNITRVLRIRILPQCGIIFLTYTA